MDNLTPEKRSKVMASIKGRDTRPELLVRRFLHARGFRFRVHDKRYTGRPDVILPKYAVAIFVHGCFWHGHECANFRPSSTRALWWKDKIASNQRRDVQVRHTLEEQGWRVITLFECQLSADTLASLPGLIKPGRPENTNPGVPGA